MFLSSSSFYPGYPQCGGSGILIFDHPGSRISDPGSRIPDPKTVTKERGGKKFVIILFFVVTNLTKLNIMLFLKCVRKKFVPIFKELLKLPKKFSICSQIYGFGIWDPGSRGQKSTGSRIRIRNTGYPVLCLMFLNSSSFYFFILFLPQTLLDVLKLILFQPSDFSIPVLRYTTRRPAAG